jgi:hypothetical protein
MMRRFSAKCRLLSLAAAMLCCAPAAKADLVGAQVTIGIYCCNVPTAPDLTSNC